MHGLEAALQGGVVLDVLAVLVERGGADHVQLAAGEHRLEHVARVHRALGRAGADHGVQLVDEQQDPALGGLDLGQHRLEPLLELAAVLGAGDQRRPCRGRRPSCRAALRARRRARSAGPAPRRWRSCRRRGRRSAPGCSSVLRLRIWIDAADLGVPADHRVELAGAGLGDQVAAVLLQRLVGPLGGGRGDPLVAAHLGQRGQEARPGSRRAPSAAARRRWPSPPRPAARSRCSTETYSSLSRLASRSAASSSRASRWVTDDLARGGAGPGDVRAAWPGRRSTVGAQRRRRRRRPGRAAGAPGPRAGRAGRAADARRRPRCGPAAVATLCASCSASCDFWVSRFMSTASAPPVPGDGARLPDGSMRSSRSSTSPSAA